MQERNYYKNVWAEFDNEKAMVFVSGGRQAGKTTLAKDLASKESVSLYFNIVATAADWLAGLR